MRRLSAYRELLAETEDPAYALIPAGMMARRRALEALYRRMVDENLVRKDIILRRDGSVGSVLCGDPLTDCERHRQGGGGPVPERGLSEAELYPGIRGAARRALGIFCCI